jgi:hypothetical protein
MTTCQIKCTAHRGTTVTVHDRISQGTRYDYHPIPSNLINKLPQSTWTWLLHPPHPKVASRRYPSHAIISTAMRCGTESDACIINKCIALRILVCVWVSVKQNVHIKKTVGAE